MKLIDKVALLYIRDGKILSSRSYGKDKFYFPGGKREGQESDEECLLREIKEELDVDIIPSTLELYGVFSAQAHGKTEGILVQMTCYTAAFEGVPAASNEIEELKWLTYEDRYGSSPVDILIFEDLHKKGLIL